MQIEHDLSICTVVNGPLKGVERLLQSIYSTADPVAVEIIIANIAGPSSGTDTFADGFPEVKFFDLTGVAPAQAKNHLIRLARGRFIGLFDFDLVLAENCLKTLVDFMDDHPDIGVAGPQIVNAYGVLERTVRAFHTVPAIFGQALGKGWFPDFLWKKKHFLEGWNHRSTREIDWLCGGAHVIRRELIEDLGLLCESLPNFFEQEYYIRALKSGWHNYYIHEAQAVHPNPSRYGALTDALETKKFSVLEVIYFFYRKWFGPKAR